MQNTPGRIHNEWVQDEIPFLSQDDVSGRIWIGGLLVVFSIVCVGALIIFPEQLWNVVIVAVIAFIAVIVTGIKAMVAKTRSH